MPHSPYTSHPYNHNALEAESSSSAYNLLFLLAGLSVAMYAFARFAESNNRLNFDNRFARIISGFLLLVMNMLHTKEGDLVITNPKNTLLAIGPHRTTYDSIIVGAKIKGTPPRFFATTGFNTIPGVAFLMRIFQTIPVEADTAKSANGRSANADALENASDILKQNGCVAIFPQGNFSRLGQKPPRIYSGVAKLALKNKIPIQVIRLDGFWSLQNPFIPLVIRNSIAYRLFLSMFHINNVRATLCCKIDFHLKSGNEQLNEEQMTNELCAQLYAYYRDTRDLSFGEIEKIKTTIATNKHHLIWKNKLEQDRLEKQLVTLTQEEASFDTLSASPNC